MLLIQGEWPYPASTLPQALPDRGSRKGSHIFSRTAFRLMKKPWGAALAWSIFILDLSLALHSRQNAIPLQHCLPCVLQLEQKSDEGSILFLLFENGHRGLFYYNNVHEVADATALSVFRWTRQRQSFAVSCRALHSQPVYRMTAK